MDASTHCQLRCPSCPTAKGLIKERLGGGSMTPESFRRLLDENPTIAHVELSNWGEIFLNAKLEEILEIAFERNVALTASNGVNMNDVKPRTLEAVVKYRVRHMTVSIDGASQESYEKYRVRGRFDDVIANLELLKSFKAKHQSPFPFLLWQFIAFGHNEHEIDEARALAERLGMQFYVKLSWEEKFSPVKNLTRVRRATKGGAASRSEYRKKHKNNYIQKSICRQLWDQPQINFDGRVLGCCANTWGDYGNAFEEGLMPTLDGERMRYAKRMVMGKAPARQDIPCSSCHHWRGMTERGDFVTDEDIETPLIRGASYRVLRRAGRRVVGLTNTTNPLANRVFERAVTAVTSRLLK